MTDYNVRSASARLGGLSSYGRTPDRAEELDARRQLHAARIDREVRDTMRAGITLDDVRAAYLIGLLLGACGVKYDVASVIESTVRAAVTDAQKDGEQE